MKKIAFATIFLFPFIAMAQFSGPYTINGKAGNYNAPAKVYLKYEKYGVDVIDSSIITNGIYSFSGHVDEPVHACLYIDSIGRGFRQFEDQVLSKNKFFFAYQRPLRLENTIITVTSSDTLNHAKITGSEINDDAAKLWAVLKPSYDQDWEEIKKRSWRNINKNPSKSEYKESEKKELTRRLARDNAKKGFIQKNPDSYVSLMTLAELITPVADAEELFPYYDVLTSRLRESRLGKSLKTKLSSKKGLSLGATAADFEFIATNSKFIKLSSFKGKYVLLSFWASWCDSSRLQHTSLTNTYHKFSSRNFTIISITRDIPVAWDYWIEAVAKDGLIWTNVRDENGSYNPSSFFYSITTLPRNLLIDPQGIIIAKDLYGDQLDTKLSDLLAKR